MDSLIDAVSAGDGGDSGSEEQAVSPTINADTINWPWIKRMLLHYRLRPHLNSTDLIDKDVHRTYLLISEDPVTMTAKHTKYAIMIAAAVAMTLLMGCATSSRTVQRTSADTQTDLSGRWNDTDARLVAEEMVDDMLERPWLQRFSSNEQRQPVVIVGAVRNRSSEHIDTSIFISDIERELVNSGMVRFVAASEQREEIRDERLDQQTQAAEETISRLGEETGADFMMQGSISSTVDAVEGARAVFYQVDMELINIQSNEKVWIGSKEIKKIIEQRRSRF